jgi:hypothetical protein
MQDCAERLTGAYCQETNEKWDLVYRTSDRETLTLYRDTKRRTVFRRSMKSSKYLRNDSDLAYLVTLSQGENKTLIHCRNSRFNSFNFYPGQGIHSLYWTPLFVLLLVVTVFGLQDVFAVLQGIQPSTSYDYSGLLFAGAVFMLPARAIDFIRIRFALQAIDSFFKVFFEAKRLKWPFTVAFGEQVEPSSLAEDALVGRYHYDDPLEARKRNRILIIFIVALCLFVGVAIVLVKM